MHQQRRPDASLANSVPRHQALPQADDAAAAAAAAAVPGERRPRRERKVPASEPHTQSEEYAAYVSFVFVLAGVVVACVGMSEVAWRVPVAGTARAGLDEAFGLVMVHIDGATHYLETPGFVWSVYTASRCALAFSILGVLVSVWVLLQITAFIRNNRGNIVGVLGRSFFAATWYLWALALYSALFPAQPFKGELFYYQLGLNSTITPQAHTQQHHLFAQQHTVQLAQWREQPSSTDTLPFSELLAPAARITSVAAAASVLAPRRLPPVPAPVSAGIPTFPLIAPVPVSRDATVTTPMSASDAAKLVAYAKDKYEHIGVKWHNGLAFYLLLLAAGLCLLLPVAGTLFYLVQWLWERHKAAEVQVVWAIPPVALLWCAWLLAIIACSTRYWKWSDSRYDGSWHLGLDRVTLDKVTWYIADVNFGEDDSRIRHASAAALAFGCMGIMVGFCACAAAVYHVYDAALVPIKVLALCTLTALCFLVSLLVYACATPHYIGGRYYELGYSFWMLTAAGLVFVLPLVALLLYLLVRRFQRTTHDERLVLMPTSMALLSILCSIAAMGSNAWATAPAGGPDSGDNHLGLLRGRLDGEWLLLHGLARASSPEVIAAGTACLVLTLCAIAIQLPVLLMGLNFARGDHLRCGGRGQMPLLATALSLSSLMLYILASIVYPLLMPWNELPAGYGLSHSWRVGVTCGVWSLLSTVGFAYLAEPPPEGEVNMLAAAISVPNSPSNK